MGWFDEYLVLLKERQTPKSFIIDLHKKFETINLNLIIDDQEFIVFSDTRDQKEKDIFDLTNSTTEEEVVDLLCEWPALGLLGYKHPKFSSSVAIIYHTWDDNLIDGFSISFNGHEASVKEKETKQLVIAISNLVDYRYIVGDIGKVSSTYVDLDQDLSAVINYIENQKFEIDIRR